MRAIGQDAASGSTVTYTELTVDHNGSPVSFEEADWLIYFVPGLVEHWWHPFVHEAHQHVFAIRRAGRDRWTLFDPWRHRLLTATITTEQARQFLLWGARGDVLLARESIPGRGSQVRGWMTCAALVSYLLGRPYWVWTPHRLFKLLLREPNVSRVDVSALLGRRRNAERWSIGSGEKGGADDAPVRLSA
jgi:hypothetical protein